MSKIVAVTNQKGGSGKTTVAMALAGEAGRRGPKVLLVDADAQGTATQYAAAAPDDRPFPAIVSGLAAAGEKIHREIKKHIDAYDLIVVDCPPAVDAVTPQSALLVADLALIPVLPSPADLWAAAGARTLVERIQAINEGLQARLVLNAVQPNARLTQIVLENLDDFGIPLLAARLSSRTAYRQSMALGLPVAELGSSARQAADEVAALTAEVLGLLGLKTRKLKAVA